MRTSTENHAAQVVLTEPDSERIPAVPKERPLHSSRVSAPSTRAPAAQTAVAKLYEQGC